MTKDQLENLTINQKVKTWKIDLKKGRLVEKLGRVTKIYNENFQVQVMFEDETLLTVNYLRIEIT